MAWIFWLVSLNTNAVRQVTRINVFCVCLPRSHKMDCFVFSMSGSSKSKRWHEEAAAIERDSGGGRS